MRIRVWRGALYIGWTLFCFFEAVGIYVLALWPTVKEYRFQTRGTGDLIRGYRRIHGAWKPTPSPKGER